MTRWQRLWLSVKLIAAVAAFGFVGVQAFFYMLESPESAHIHPLSILVVGLIFGFISFGLLSLIERGIRGVVAPSDNSEAQFERDAELTLDEPLTPSSDVPTQQKEP